MASTRADLFVSTTKQLVYYRDFNDKFETDPLTGDLILLINEKSVNQAVSNLIRKTSTELPYDTSGSLSSLLLFEPVNALTTTMLQQTIIETIRNYEPRIQLQTVVVNPYPDQNLYEVNVTYNLINSQTSVTLTEILERVR